MRKPNTLVLAILGALAAHAIVLFWGGMPTATAPEKTENPENPEKAAKRPPVQPIRITSQNKSKPSESKREPETPKPAPPPPPESSRTEVAKQDAPKAEPVKPEPVPAPREQPVQQVAQKDEATAASAPAAPPPPPALPQPPQPKAPEPFAAPGAPAAAPTAVVESGPAPIAAAQASDAQVESSQDAGGDGEPAAPAPMVAPVPPPAAAIPVATTPIVQTPQPAPVTAPAAAPVQLAASEPVNAIEPRSPALRLGGVTTPRRLGPAWKAAADAIGPVPAVPTPAPAASIRPSSRRAREIPPVDISAATARTPVAYKPLNMPRDLQGDPSGMATLSAAAASVAMPAPAATATPTAPPPPASPAPSSAGTGRGLGRGPGKGATATATPGAAPGGAAPADRGRLAPGASVPQEPVARIAWGSADDALRTLDAARMQLVMVDADLKIVGGVDRSGPAWSRTAVPAQMAAYSNRVRVVDHVAGFAQYGSLCGPGEHLAVIVPIGLDRRIEKSMDEAARRAGLTRQQVAACYGRLVTQPTGVEFQVERVERRNQP